MLKILISIPLLGIFFLNIFKERGRIIGMISSIITFYLSLILLLQWNNNDIEYQFRDSLDLLFYSLTLGLDGLSLFLIVLTTVLMPILFLLEERKEKESANNIVRLLLLMESMLIFLFSSLDLFFFFLSFELLLIPMFLLIGSFGSPERKIEAAYRFIIYSLFGSLIMLISIIVIFIKYGSTHNEVIAIKASYDNLFVLKLFWLSFFFSFAIKVPIFPFHTWLPFVHVEAPTIGSMLLAGIMLKLGTYGILRYNLGVFGIINHYFIPIVLIMAVLSIVYGALTTIRQIDLKKIIAYSSIVHMNYGIIGFFTNEIEGLSGSSYLMLSHAFISCALFLLVGILYKRYHTRIISYYQGLVYTMPLFSSLFLLFSLANISLPFTSAFIAEILILISTFKSNLFIGILISIALILSTIYALWLSNRILFGQISPFLFLFQDLSKNEMVALLPLLFFTLLFGVNSHFILDSFSLPLLNLL